MSASLMVDTPMDFADACLVRMTEILPQPRVWTTDSDFLVYRRYGKTSIPLLAPWEAAGDPSR